MPNPESLQLNLGSLRSNMSLTLHTHHASRIWRGRASSERQAAIVGLNGYIVAMNKMKRGSEQDDPYSDWWMLRIEDKLDQTKATLHVLREQVEQVLVNVPPALDLGENLNVQPVKLPLFISAQLGFAAVYLLAEYDDIVRKLLLAHHAALIDRATLDGWLNDGAHALRSLFALSQHYRYSGCTRDDFAANNAAARAALEKFGELPQDVLEGIRRSRFAPPIMRRRGVQASHIGTDSVPEPAAENNEPAASTEAEPAVSDDGESA